MPLPGQYFCVSCMRPVRTPGQCDACMAKEVRVRRAGNYCDHCNTNGTHSLIYINKKTKKRYCVDCRATFRTSLITKGFEVEQATKIMVEDFVLVNDPLKKTKIHKK